LKTALIVSFNFPPLAKISVVRALKFCKYLPNFQWTPWIYTVDPKYYGEALDHEAFQDAKQMQTHRIPYVQMPFARTIVSLLFPFLALHFILKNRKAIDVVYMVGSPYHPFIISSILTTIIQMPVVLDFRDSWSMNYGFDGKKRNELSLFDRTLHSIYHWIEKLSLQYASVAVFATRYLEQEYIDNHPKYSDKYVTICNGYDEDDFKNITPIITFENEKSIIICGKFAIYLGDQLSLFFQAVQEIPEVFLIYVGSEHKTMRAMAKDFKVTNRVKVFPFKPYSETLRLLAGCDYGLLSHGMVNGMGTKIFDYLALKKAFLCLVPEGSIITDTFGHLNSMITCKLPLSKESIIQGFRSLICISGSDMSDEVAFFNRRNATEKLSRLFDRVTK
jgi:glycosyltransferase involved in cell wall biosynthesis